MSVTDVRYVRYSSVTRPLARFPLAMQIHMLELEEPLEAKELGKALSLPQQEQCMRCSDARLPTSPDARWTCVLAGSASSKLLELAAWCVRDVMCFGNSVSACRARTGHVFMLVV